MRLIKWRPQPQEAEMIRSQVRSGKSYEWNAEFFTKVAGAKLRLRDTRLERGEKLPCPRRFALDLVCHKDRDRSDATIYSDSLLDLAALAIALMQSPDDKTNPLYVPQAEAGHSFWMEINQGKRFCVITDVKRNRARIEYEMPNAGEMGGYVPIVRLGWRAIVATSIYRSTDRFTSPIDGKSATAKITILRCLGPGGDEPRPQLVFVADRLFYGGWTQTLKGGSLESLMGKKFDSVMDFHAEVRRLCFWTRIDLTRVEQEDGRTIYNDKEGRVILREE